MTCADARHRILIADMSALRGETDRGLRAHLDRCPACNATASRVLGETARLGAALVARARQPEIRRGARRRTMFAVAPIGIAASMALILVAHRVSNGPVASTRPMVTTHASSILTSISDGDTDLVLPSVVDGGLIAGRHATEFVPLPSRRTSARSERAIRTPVSAVRASVDAAAVDVGVTVGDNQRAAIIATPNPNITVIWLSRGQRP